ncbi:CLUMA_CG008497, isoform A [Clunio marinus]|uniref:CLUMA_CG008497, isoform A n=1 Tax=Clunio marinus TaxID=568069 RepID=A0A1J1I491_9DIPT|nr:CLUMA_CG008497, isoform A [Clunio marinus]
MSKILSRKVVEQKCLKRLIMSHQDFSFNCESDWIKKFSCRVKVQFYCRKDACKGVVFVWRSGHFKCPKVISRISND